MWARMSKLLLVALVLTLTGCATARQWCMRVPG